MCRGDRRRLVQHAQARVARPAVQQNPHRRTLSQLIPARNDPAIERKHQNISAILIEAKQPCIRGYKPLSQCQALLSGVVWEHIEEDLEFQELGFRYAAQPVLHSELGDVLAIMTSPPDLLEAAQIALATQRQRRARMIDYLAREGSSAYDAISAIAFNPFASSSPVMRRRFLFGIRMVWVPSRAERYRGQAGDKTRIPYHRHDAPRERPRVPEP